MAAGSWPVAKATKLWIERQTEEGGVLSTKKSSALALDIAARRWLKQSLRAEGIVISRSACDLDVDSACAGRRRTVKLTMRSAVRGARLKGKAVSMSRLAKIFAVPKGSNGTKVVGISKRSFATNKEDSGQDQQDA